jgi:hypothetical protein
MKKILAVFYSQTGQLEEVLDSVLKPLERDPQFSVTRLYLQPVPDYPFPWTAMQFCDVFPEAFAEIPGQLRALDTADKDYDLVVLAWTVWFLSPSIPVSSFLQSDAGQRLMQDTKVISLVGCRNMWTVAYDKLKKRIADSGGKLVGNIVLTERTSNLIGILTIALWMLTGKKERFLRIFPRPGINRQDIYNASRFGEYIRRAWSEKDLQVQQSDLLALGAVSVDPALVFMEKRVSGIFRKWAAFIRARGGPGALERRNRVRAFLGYLLTAVVFLAPLSQVAAWLWGKISKHTRDLEVQKYQGL